MRHVRRLALVAILGLASCGGDASTEDGTQAGTVLPGGAGAGGEGAAGAAGAKGGAAGKSAGGAAGKSAGGAAGGAGFPQGTGGGAGFAGAAGAVGGKAGAGGATAGAAGGGGGAGKGGSSAGAAGTSAAGGTSTAGTGGTASGGTGSSGAPGVGCPSSFPQGVPDPGGFIANASSFQDTDPAVDNAVNQAMASLTGCGIGSDCPITGFPGGTVDEICQSWFAAVTDKLRAQGYCAGQHVIGSTDEIAVSNTSCTGKWYGYHICFYGGPKVVWNPGARRGWWMIDPQYCQ